MVSKLYRVEIDQSSKMPRFSKFHNATKQNNYIKYIYIYIFIFNNLIFFLIKIFNSLFFFFE
jgi:hypothetical protein